MYIYILICLLLSISLILITYILNRKDNKDNKRMKYECGEEEYIETNIYTIMYYKIAVTYLVFDIETILLFPTALINFSSFSTIYIIIYFFILILFLGLFIEYFNNIYS